MILSAEIVAAAAKIHPLRDKVIVWRLEYKHPVLAVVGIVLSKGIVVAVGPGRPMRRKTRFDKIKGQESGSIWFEDGDLTGQIRPMRVKVGDVVEFVPRTEGRTADTEFEVDGVKFLCIREQSIFGKTTDSQHEAQLEVRAVGYNKEGKFVAGE